MVLVGLKSDAGGDDIEVPVESEAFMDDFFAQIEDIRSSIDKIDESVTEIKKLYSTILSAPTSDQKTQDDVEALTNEIKKSANNARNKLKSRYWFGFLLRHTLWFPFVQTYV